MEVSIVAKTVGLPTFLKNINFYVSQKQETHADLKQHES